MPEAETQVYWHECNDPRPPWSSAEDLQRIIHRSRQLRGMRIAPVDFFLEHTQEERRILRRRIDIAERADRGLLMEPGMTIFGVLNLLMQHLGRAPLSQQEAADAVETISRGYRAAEQRTQQSFLDSQTAGASQQQLNNGAAQTASGRDGRRQRESQPVGATSTATAQEVKEAPLLQCIRELLEKRSLKINVLNKKEVRLKRNRITSQDLMAGKKVAILVDKQRPSMAAVMMDGKVVASAVRSSMHLMVPVAEPCPWRRRVFAVHDVDPLQAIMAFIYHADLDETDAMTDSDEGDNGSSQSRRSAAGSVARSQLDAELAAPPEPLELAKRTGRLLTLTRRKLDLRPPHRKEASIEEDPKHERAADRSHHGGPLDAKKKQDKTRKRTRSGDTASTNDQRGEAHLSPHDNGRTSTASASSSSGCSSSSGDAIYGEPLGVPMLPSAGLKRAAGDDLALVPYAVHRNNHLVASALAQQVDPEAVAGKPHGFHRRVVSWMEPMVTALHQSSTRTNADTVAERTDNLARCGAHMSYTLGGSAKLFFPDPHGVATADAHGAPMPPVQQRVVDPFMELPSIEIATKYQQRKNVKHSWTQRLIENERRDKLYVS